MDGRPAVIIDTGSSTMKVGFSGENHPRSVFPSIVGRPRYQTVLLDVEDHRGVFVGASAQSKRGVLGLEHPMMNRAVKDWEAMELIWRHALYDELGLTGKGGSTLLTVGPQSERSMRERMMRCFFESFSMDRVHLSVQPLLALYATGRSTGLVVDSGQDLTHVVPVHDGTVLRAQMQKLDLGGHSVTTALAQQLGPEFMSPTELDIVREIKEHLAYVALDFDAEMKSVANGQLEPSLYALPDGTQVTVPAERFLCAELIFRPQLPGGLGSGARSGLVDLVNQSATSCEGLQEHMFSNIVMAGGNTLLPNMERRLERDLRPLVPNQVRVVAPPERNYSVWLGGSILASLSSFQSHWITRAEFEEHGGAILKQKC